MFSFDTKDELIFDAKSSYLEAIKKNVAWIQVRG